MSVFRGQSLGFLGTWGISELWAQDVRGSGAEKVAWFLASLWRVEGGRQSLLLLAVGCRMEDRTPSKESRWDQASENNPDSTSLAPECVLSGNSGPVGIWDNSLVAFCRVKKKSHFALLFGSVIKSRFFFSPCGFPVVVISPPPPAPNLKKEIQFHTSWVVGPFRVQF